MNTHMHTKKILIVDDDIAILNMIEILLKKENFTNIYKTTSGFEAIQLNETILPDLIILDIMLPNIDGYEVCKQIRTTSMVPILFLSAKDNENDKLTSFAMGGDDYLTKPFSSKELIARIGAILKRQDFYESKQLYNKNYYFGSFNLDLQKQELYNNETLVNLTLKEYQLLAFLIINKNITVSKEQILENVWNDSYEGYENTIMVHIRHLREKIESEPSNPQYILTVKGRGYRFEG